MSAGWRLMSIPFDVFYQITILLDNRDFIHLSRTNKIIHERMKNDVIARKIIENDLFYSKEGQIAMASQAGYYNAINHRFDVHEAIATAAPYSVTVLAYAADFLYHNGFLCYRIENEVRLLDLHARDCHERVINLKNLISDEAFEFGGHLSDIDDPSSLWKLAHYDDGFLVFWLERMGILLGTYLEHPDAIQQGQLKLLAIAQGTEKLFVRHSRSYLWYGTFTFPTNNVGGMWSVCGQDLMTQEEVVFSLDGVTSCDIGETLYFEMYQEHLYAISIEDDDNNSFYRWFCFAPRQELQRSGRLWRREHREGPLTEIWTDLSIQIDETFGRPVILECRREWLYGNNSENHRTLYTQPLPTPEETLAGICPPHTDYVPEVGISTHEPTAQHLSKRLPRFYHSEFEREDGPRQRKEFIRAHTKHRSYHLGAATFVDLVIDRDRLLLRTVARNRKCPIDEEKAEGPNGLLFRPTQMDAKGRFVDGSEERFVSRGVHMWPPDDASSTRQHFLRHLLRPEPSAMPIRAVSDERSLLYTLPCRELPPSHFALVLISFDPTIHFSNLSSLRSLEEPVIPTPIFPVQTPRSSACIIREESAFYLGIDHSYWLR